MQTASRAEVGIFAIFLQRRQCVLTAANPLRFRRRLACCVGRCSALLARMGLKFCLVPCFTKVRLPKASKSGW
jgi:hypothetical protein